MSTSMARLVLGHQSFHWTIKQLDYSWSVQARFIFKRNVVLIHMYPRTLARSVRYIEVLFLLGF